MAIDASAVQDLIDAKVAVAVAGGLVVGVIVAVRAIDWLRLVLIEREASREYYERYGR